MSQTQRPHVFEHPHSLGSFRNWIRLLKESEGIDREYWLRVLFVCFSTLITSPLRLYEKFRFDHELEKVNIHPAPIFILGHWRTGTTHLHNLLSQDEHFAWVNTFQCLAPEFCLSGNRFIKLVLAEISRRLHPTRLIDNIPLSLDAPQEEDFAVANMSPYSFIHLFTFPRQASQLFRKYVLLEDLSEQALENWIQVYLKVLRKATFLSGGKQPVLKGPANSGRIPTMLSLFPDARFIHICRNPYQVFMSMRWVYKTVLPRAQVQKIEQGQVDANILEFYSLMMRKFLMEKSLICPENLVEIRFEDLEIAPLEQIRLIYQNIDLPGFEKAEPAIQDYLSSIAGYQKNQYTLTNDVITKVNQHWGFAFEAWGYPQL